MINNGDSTEIKYVKIKTKDNFSFYLPSFVANMSPKLKNEINKFRITNVNDTVFEYKLNYRKAVVDEVTDYLNYKYYYEEISKQQPLQFNVSDELSLEILLCSKELGI